MMSSFQKTLLFLLLVNPVFAQEVINLRNQGINVTANVTASPEQTAITLLNCSGVLKGDVDYDPLPFSQGTITKVTHHWVTLRIDDGYTLPDSSWSEAMGGNTKLILFRNNVMVPVILAKAQEIIHQAGRVVAVKGSPNFTVDCRVGDRLALPWRTKPHAVWLNRCHDMNVRLTVHAAPNMGLALTNCDNMIIDVVVNSPPDRLLSTNADGVQLIDCYNTRVVIHVAKCGDDAFNAHGYVSKPAPGRNDLLNLRGAAFGCFGGVKASGTNTYVHDFVSRDNLGAVHFGSDEVVFDSGPRLGDYDVLLERLTILRCAGAKANYPAVLVARQTGSALVVANIWGEPQDVKYQLVRYVRR